MAQSNSSNTWQKKGFGWIPDLPDMADPSLNLALDNKPRLVSREGIDHLEGIANILSTLLKDKGPKKSKQLEDFYNQILGETRFPNVRVYKILRKPEESCSQEFAQIRHSQAKEIVQLKQAFYWIYRESRIPQKTVTTQSGIPALFLKAPNEVLKWLQDPEFDSDLEEIVKLFQGQNQLVDDGIVGLRTYISLKARLAKKPINEQNVELLCPFSIIPQDILKEVFQKLTYTWLFTKFSSSIDQAFEYFSIQHSLAPNQNEYAVRMKAELHAIVHECLKEISSDFRKRIQSLSTKAANREKPLEETIQDLKGKLTKLKDQLICKSNELAITVYQELDRQFGANEGLKKVTALRPESTIFKELYEILAVSLKKLDDFLCSSDSEKGILNNSFIIYSDDEFTKQFHTWFHIVEPFISAIFQILSPLANFDNYRQAIDTGFNKLDSCFQLHQLEYASKIASYKNLLLEYSPTQTADQLEELQELRKTIVSLFQETIAKIHRIRSENLDYRPHILTALENFLLDSNIEADRDKNALAQQWKNCSAKILTPLITSSRELFLSAIEDKLLRFEEKEREKKEKKHKMRIRSLCVLFARERLSKLADDLSELQLTSDSSKSVGDKLAEDKKTICKFVKEELAEDKKAIDSYFRFFEFLGDIISEKYGVRLKKASIESLSTSKSTVHADSDSADPFDEDGEFYGDFVQSKTQAELVSFLTLKKELFEIQDVEDWGEDTVQMDGNDGRSLFFEPTVVQLPINANLMEKAGRQIKLKTTPSDDIQPPKATNPTRFYFFLPGLVDLSYWCPPIEDQEDVNACTAFAGVSLLEYFAQKRYGKYTNLSARFLYKTARNLMNRSDDTGASVRQTMKALVLFGVPPEEVWPWRTEDFNEEPPAFCYAYAQSYQALKYFRLDAAGSGAKDASLTARELLLFQIKAVLAAGLPCIFGFTIYSSFFKDRNIRFGYIPYPSSRDQIMGGHTAVAVGYNDHKRIDRIDGEPTKPGAILIRNSWGTIWGNGGYGWMPYEYVLDGLTADWWSLLKSEWFDGGAFGLGAVDPGNPNKPKGPQKP